MLLMIPMPFVAMQLEQPVLKFDRALAETLEELPEAYIDGNEAELPGLSARARRQWEHARRPLAAYLTEGELAAFEQNLTAMPAMKPRLQAEAALDLCGILNRHLRPSRNQKLREADRLTMLAWCRTEARCWDTMPDLMEPMATVMVGDRGRHPEAVKDLQATLALFQKDLAQKSRMEVKRDLRQLLNLLDLLERNPGQALPATR